MKIHPNYILEDDGRGNKKKKEFLGLARCPGKHRRCKKCNMPFTVSNAIEELVYCGMYCEGSLQTKKATRDKNP